MSYLKNSKPKTFCFAFQRLSGITVNRQITTLTKYGYYREGRQHDESNRALATCVLAWPEQANHCFHLAN